MDETGTDLEPVGSGAVEPRQRVLPAVVTPRATQALELVVTSPEIGEVFGALAMAQGAYGEVERTLTAKINSSKAVYSYDYESLADLLTAVRPALSANGLALMQFPTTRIGERGGIAVVVRTLLGHKSGQWIANDLSALADGPDPRSIGSCITYLRRYAVKSILGIAPDNDDDGAAASGKSAAPQAAPRVSQQQAKTAPKAEVAPEPVGPVSTAHAAAVAQPDPTSGTVTTVVERGGGALVTLSTGYSAATRDAAMVAALKRHQQTGQVVELVTRPSSDPSKYAPVITEIALQSREPGQEG
jgi:hypothetical protein